MRSQLQAAAGLAGALLLASGPAAAQTSLDLSLSPAWESFSSAVERPDDPTLAGAFDLQQQLGAVRLWYSLDGATYADEGAWASWRHGLGATLRLGPEDGRARLYLGGSAALRRNGSSWADANYDGLGAFANVEARPWGGVTLRSGYRFDVRAFDGLPSLDQRQHDGFFSLRANLPSRTTLIGELHLGRKHYDGDLVTILTPLDDPAAPTTPVQAGAGRGQGGAGRAQLPRPAVVTPVTFGTGPSRADQVSWLVRVAQSLADRTGLSLQYSQRRSSGDVPPALVSTPALFFDDGVYDDPFASDALALRGSLKQAFASGAWVEASGAWTRKEYRAQPALDLDGLALASGALRLDRVAQASLAGSLPLLASRTGAWTLVLEPAWRYTRSRSNDAYYDYSSHAVEVGVSLSY